METGYPTDFVRVGISIRGITRRCTRSILHLVRGFSRMLGPGNYVSNCTLRESVRRGVWHMSSAHIRAERRLCRTA
jgi:hypothetical protein